MKKTAAASKRSNKPAASKARPAPTDDFPGVGRKAMLLNARRRTSEAGQPLPPAKTLVPKARTDKDANQIRSLLAEQAKSRANAAQSVHKMAQMQEQRNQLELQNTQLLDAQANLELGRQRYADLYNNAPVGYMTLDGKGCIREMNQTAGELLGWSPAHLQGRPLVPHVAAADRKAFSKHLRESGRGTTQVITTLRLIAKQGIERYVQFATSNSHSLGDRPSWCRTAMLDITAQHHAEEALRLSEARFRLLAENMGEVFWFMDLDPLRVSYVSPAFEHIYGASVAELYENPLAWQNAIHSEDLPGVHTAFEHWIKGATAAFNVEYRVTNRKGDIHWVADRGIVIKRKDGVPHQISGIATDITERKLVEQELREAQRFAQSTLEAVPASLAVLDETGTIISTNHSWHQFAEAHGALPNAVATGTNYLAVCDAAGGDGVTEAARFAEGIREVMSGARSRYSVEYPCHGAGLQRWFVGYVTAFSGDGMPRVVIAHVDISERKRAEQVIRRLNIELETRVEERTAELRLANEKLRHQIARRRRLEAEILEISESEQQRIGQDLHDDLGQQLAGISCLSRVLENNLTAQESPEAELAAKITDLLKNALGLTRSLARGLHPVALQSGGLMTALDELTQRISEMFRVTCRCKCPPVPHMDNTMATHLYRIAQEAVTNAVKHGHAREIEIALSFNAHHTVLSVKDDGAGLPAPDPCRKGMGLRIMTYRADMIGGALAIQNDQSNGGTIVTCTIPTPHHEPSTD